ncbi:anti-sigma factor [Streptosporangium sp. NPDC048047]|uniref:anti-sigma factor n=1 Tax=Streptosporangium sp. NPDC048047 TaxID=3155748 RepID=UPI00342EEB54
MTERRQEFDPHTLAGAYALNALDDELERHRFEQHLAGCQECAREIATLMETAARMGAAVAAEPPPGLRARVMAEIEQVRQLPPAVARPRRRPGGWRPWLAAAGVAAMLAAVVAMGVTTLQTRSRLEEIRRSQQEITAVMTAPDARTSTAVSGGMRGGVLVSRSERRMVFWASGLPDPPAGRVYQLWRLAPGEISSAGLLTVSSGSATPVLVTAGAGTARLGMTQEPAGGSRQPTGDPILLVDIPAA